MYASSSRVHASANACLFKHVGDTYKLTIPRELTKVVSPCLGSIWSDRFRRSRSLFTRHGSNGLEGKEAGYCGREQGTPVKGGTGSLRCNLQSQERSAQFRICFDLNNG